MLFRTRLDDSLSRRGVSSTKFLIKFRNYWTIRNKREGMDSVGIRLIVSSAPLIVLATYSCRRRVVAFASWLISCGSERLALRRNSRSIRDRQQFHDAIGELGELFHN